MYINPLRLRVLDRVFTRETLAEREWTFRCVNQSEVNTNLITKLRLGQKHLRTMPK